MVANSTYSSLPNSETSLPSLNQTQAVIYVSISALSAYAWDWVVSIPEEIRMCSRRKFTTSMVAYFLSRIGTLAFCALTVVLEAASIEHCNALTYVIGACLAISMTASSALFIFRVRAVYYNNRIITVFFSFLWTVLLGITLSFLPSVRSGNIGTTKRCTIVKVTRYASVPGIIHCVIDTLIFIAISLRIMSFSFGDRTLKTRARAFFRGRGLPNLSRALLQGGQLYFFATIALNITATTMVLAPVPVVFHTVMTLPNFALESAMACRVFRHIRIGFITDFDVTTTTTTANPQDQILPQPPRPSRSLVAFPMSEQSFDDFGVEDPHCGALQVKIAKTTCSRIDS